MARSTTTLQYWMTVYLKSPILFSGSILASNGLDSQPSRACKLKITLAGITSGTLTITGLLGTTPKTETLTYDQSRPKTSIQSYSSVSSIEASEGLVGGTMEIDSVDEGGALITSETENTNNKCFFAPLSPASPVYERYGIEKKTLFLVRVKNDNPIITADEETEFSTSCPGYSGQRFKPASDIITKGRYEQYFYAAKV